MADGRYADFDAAFAEREREADPLRIRLFEQEWDLPGSLPAGVLLKLSRYMAEGRTEKDLTYAESIDLAASMIPEEILQQWIAKGISEDQLGDIVMWALRQYTGQDDEPGEAAEVEAPVTPSSSSSSSVGASSKPTSPESTGSPYPAT